MLLAACALLALTGCTPAAPAAAPDAKPVVLTTFSVLADLVREVGGDKVDVVSITKPGTEIHGYEPTPSDLVRVHEADLVLDNGLGLERWFEPFVRDLKVPHAVLSAGIEPADIGSGAYTGKPNPHAWMSPVAAQQYVLNARDALTTLIPAQADYFAQRATGTNAKLARLLDDARAALSTVPEPALASCEGAFSYLARDLGLKESFLWPVNSDSEGTPRQIRTQIDFVTAHRPAAIFCESTINPGPQQRVAEATGVPLRGPLYVDSLSGPDGPVPTFLQLIEYDIKLILEGQRHAS